MFRHSCVCLTYLAMIKIGSIKMDNIKTASTSFLLLHISVKLHLKLVFFFFTAIIVRSTIWKYIHYIWRKNVVLPRVGIFQGRDSCVSSKLNFCRILYLFGYIFVMHNLFGNYCDKNTNVKCFYRSTVKAFRQLHHPREK